MGIYADNAEKYFKAGFSPIPVIGKKGVTFDWGSYSKNQIEYHELEKFVSKYKDYNIGVVLGPASGIVCFDFDYFFEEKHGRGLSKEAYRRLKMTIESEQDFISQSIAEMLPHSPCQKIGREGKISYFFKAKGPFESRSFKRNGITLFEILWNGKQTVLPPSIHPDTKKPYRWINGDLARHYEDLPELDWGLVEEIGRKFGGDFIPRAEGESRSQTIAGRNDLLKKMLFGMFMRGLVPSKCVDQLMEIDQERCSPPLFSDKEEFPKHYQNPRNAAKVFIKSCFKTYKNNLLTEPSKRAVTEEPLVDLDTGEVISDFYILKDSGKEVPDYAGLVQFLKSKNLVFAKDQRFYERSKCGRFFSQVDPKDELRIINHFTRGKVLNYPAHLHGFSQSMRAGLSGVVDFEDDNVLLNLQTCVFDIKERRVLPRENSHVFNYILPYDFDPAAQCPEWEKFLSKSLVDSELIRTLRQAFGYTLFVKGNPNQKAFMLQGSGENGKGVTLDTLSYLLGESLCSAVSLSNLGDQFQLIRLRDSKANFDYDVDFARVDTAMFKKITGEDKVVAAEKFLPSVSFKPRCKIWAGCNKLPFFGEAGHQIKRRLLIVPFEVIIKQRDVDIDLKQKLRGELAGIFNWALAGLDDYLSNGRKLFVGSKSQDCLDEFASDVDEALSFLSSCVEIGPGIGSEVSIGYLFDLFKAENPWSKIERRGFSEKVQQFVDLQISKNDWGVAARRDFKFKSKSRGANRDLYVLKCVITGAEANPVAPAWPQSGPRLRY